MNAGKTNRPHTTACVSFNFIPVQVPVLPTINSYEYFCIMLITIYVFFCPYCRGVIELCMLGIIYILLPLNEL